jgi:TRAP transporter 4TM/12TM fusion protein
MARGAGLVGLLFDIGVRREPTGALGWIVPPYGAALAVWVIVSSVYLVLHPYTVAVVFLCAMYVLVFLLVGATPRSHPERPSAADWAMAAASAACGAYFVDGTDRFMERIPVLDPLTPLDTAMGTAFFLLSLEATRRTTGLGLTTVVLIFVAYNLWGHHLPGVIGHGYIGFDQFLDTIVFSTSGIPGVVAVVAATYAFLFVLFGVLLTATGGGRFFFDVAAAFAGRSVGGPAKVAVVSSGLYGMVSGSPVSDVMTTGSVTIPVMQRTGFSRNVSAAVESAASTGGSMMPPVMGAAAFVMVEYTGIPYQDIALASLVPALLYYLAVYLQVDLHSRRIGAGALPPEEVPPIGRTMASGWPFVVPLVVLTAALVAGFSANLVAIVGCVSVVAAAAVKASTRIGVVGVYRCLAVAAQRMVVITGACAAAGLVIGGVTMTGLAQKVGLLAVTVTGGGLLPVLVFTALVTIVLGMGMPTVSAYILTAVLVGPLLQEMGIPLLAAHMFILYYAMMSAITPPVAVAAYAAAAIAQGDPMRIGVLAVRFALAAFLLPFTFAYSPELLLVGEPLDVAVAVATAVVGVALLAVAAEGYLRRPLHWAQRVLLAAAALCFIVPDPVLAAVGAAMAATALALRLAPAGPARRTP